MMPLTREVVGEPERYRGSVITARLVGPDLSCEVNGVELNGFYLNLEAARVAGRQHVDAEIKAADEAAKHRRKA